MRKTILAALGAALLAAAPALAQQPKVGPHGFPLSQAPKPQTPVPARCDRACLEGVVDQIAEAMVSKKRDGLPLSKDVKYTEMGQPLAIGDGFWATATGFGNYKHHFADPAVGQVVVMRTMQEGTGPNKDLLMALRARVELGRVTEIEAVFYRKGGGGPSWNDAGVDNLNKMGKPDPLWQQAVAESKRLTRPELIIAGNYYFDGLAGNNGKGYYPFTDTCHRLENGAATTNNKEIQAGQAFQPFSFSCIEQFSTGYYGVVTEIDHRRWLIADTERGIAVAWATFKHAGTVKTVHLTNGQDFDMSFFSRPSSILIVEAFRIVDGKIDLVEAVGASATYGLKSHWPGGISGK